jgi:HAD superfamily hydrolase (TIGR01549 family)
MKRPSSIRTILFDLDNTLIDRDHAMKQGIRHWLKDQDTVHEAEMDQELERILEKDNSGYNDRSFFCEWLSSEYAAGDAKADKGLLRELQELTISYLQPDPEILNAVQQLKQHYQLVIATNGSQYVQQKKITQTQLDTAFLPGHIYISEMLGHEKPEPGFYHRILESIAKDPEQCLMIGDNYLNDIEAARNCGLYTCWIDHKRSGKIHDADKTFTNISETVQWLQASI